MNKRTLILKHTFYWGVIAGLASIVYSLILYMFVLKRKGDPFEDAMAGIEEEETKEIESAEE